MNRRTFLKSLSASALLAKLGPAPFKAKAAPLVIKTGGAAFTLGTNQSISLQPYQRMYFDSTPMGEPANFYRLWSGNEKRPWAP